MWLCKILFKKYCSGLVEGVDLIFRILCQTSGQDNVSYEIRKPYWHFQMKKFCCNKVECRFILIIGAKGTVEIFVLMTVLFMNRICAWHRWAQVR